MNQQNQTKMRTRKLIKNTAFFLAICGGLIFTSCKKKDVEKEEDSNGIVALPSSKIATYEGDLQHGATNVNDGTATISSSGSSYTITFSNNVPSVSGLKFKLENGEYVSVPSSGSLAGVSIDGDDLDIGIFSNSNNWSFSGTKE